MVRGGRKPVMGGYQEKHTTQGKGCNADLPSSLIRVSRDVAILLIQVQRAPLQN